LAAGLVNDDAASWHHFFRCYDSSVRTTVTLDPDVERALRETIKERGISFKDALNDALRSGLMQKKAGSGRRFSQKTFSLGAEQHFRWEKALAASDAIQDEELTRKMLIRK
jgi:hypothetical protein